jgi:EAL domain-containing protein (putative c-di-GMP-specific phosphodiesterase class I)
MDMLANENDTVIVRSTIDLAHNLGLRVVAEGVENVDMLDTLRILRCDHAQGYHIGRPVPAAELATWLHAYHAKDSRPVLRDASAPA